MSLRMICHNKSEISDSGYIVGNVFDLCILFLNVWDQVVPTLCSPNVPTRIVKPETTYTVLQNSRF